MPKWMNQNLFDIGAFMLTGIWLKTRYGGAKFSLFEQALAEVVPQYEASYPQDNIFEIQWREAPAILNSGLEKVGMLASQRAEYMIAMSHAAGTMHPDGSPVKKKFGIFGGSWFADSHPDPTFRLQMCEKNFVRYYVLTRMRAAV